MDLLKSDSVREAYDFKYWYNKTSNRWRLQLHTGPRFYEVLELNEKQFRLVINNLKKTPQNSGTTPPSTAFIVKHIYQNRSLQALLKKIKGQ